MERSVRNYYAVEKGGNMKTTKATTRIITMLSDFGLRDTYVAEMKAVIVSILPDVYIVDISHKIEKFNIRMGSFILASAAPYFPKGTVHVAVVDPGVGTKRRPIIVESKRSFYVGPDNGLLLLSARKEGLSHVYHIKNPEYMRPKISTTFHGRDIFAPVAAYLALGRSPSQFGPEIEDYVFPQFAKPHMQNDEILGEVVYIDDFGNVVTNISSKDLEKLEAGIGDLLQVRIRRKRFDMRFCSAYGEVPARTPLVIVGSHDFLEISINQGNASKTFNLKIGDSFSIRFTELSNNVNQKIYE